jgi:hypothetical protein
VNEVKQAGQCEGQDQCERRMMNSKQPMAAAAGAAPAAVAMVAAAAAAAAKVMWVAPFFYFVFSLE